MVRGGRGGGRLGIGDRRGTNLTRVGNRHPWWCAFDVGGKTHWVRDPRWACPSERG